MNLSALLLKWMGWKVEITVPDFDKCIICVAPHTSNWDFIIGKLAYTAAGRDAGFLMKSSWFFLPLGCFFRAIGGIPVSRNKDKTKSLVATVVEKFNTSDRLAIAITPEGTRSRTGRWHTGFLQIARQAHVPIALAVLDFGHKTAFVRNIFTPGPDIDADMTAIKQYYKGYKGKNPDNFCTD